VGKRARSIQNNEQEWQWASAIKTYELEAIDRWHASECTERREPKLSMPTKLNMHDEVINWWGTGMGTGWKA
jgi:hypothetical protein